jgi:hypothetical protein
VQGEHLALRDFLSPRGDGALGRIIAGLGAEICGQHQRPANGALSVLAPYAASTLTSGTSTCLAAACTCCRDASAERRDRFTHGGSAKSSAALDLSAPTLTMVNR